MSFINDNRLATPNGNVRAPGLEKARNATFANAASGVREGSIDTTERQALTAQRSTYRADLNAAKENGWVSASERKQLHADLGAINQSITTYRQD